MADHPTAIVVREDPELGEIFRCPECGKESDIDGLDVGLADPGCLFCPSCHCEFYV